MTKYKEIYIYKGRTVSKEQLKKLKQKEAEKRKKYRNRDY